MIKILLFLMFSSLGAVEFSLDLRLGTKSLQVGDELQVTLESTHPLGYHLDSKELKKGLLEYFGYGMPPFFLIAEEPLKESPTKTVASFRLGTSLVGTFNVSFGVVTFHGENVSTALLSPSLPAQVILGAIDTEYIPPPPSFLLLKPLLPVEIDMEMKQRLLSSPEILLKDKRMWERFFFLRKIPLYGLLFIVLSALSLILWYAFFGTAPKKHEIPAKNIDAILRELLGDMRTIREDQKMGKIDPERALIEMQKALFDCFQLRLMLPVSSMTVEELKEALLGISKLKGQYYDIDSLLNVTLGIKFGKKTVEREKSIDMMDRSIEILENLLVNK